MVEQVQIIRITITMTLECEMFLLENNFLKECFLLYGKCSRHSFIVCYLPSIKKTPTAIKKNKGYMFPSCSFRVEEAEVVCPDGQICKYPVLYLLQTLSFSLHN